MRSAVIVFGPASVRAAWAVYLSYTPGGWPVAFKVARPEYASDP